MYRILIVDDEDAVRGALAGQLEFDKHSCACAATAEDAIELLRYEEFDLLLTDLRMPTMGGFDFLNKIKGQIEAVTPYIVVTGNGELQNAIQAIQVGAFDFVIKPWEWTQLRLTVRRALQRREDMKFRRNSELELRRQVTDALAESKATADATIVALAALLEGKDMTTGDHCERVRALCSRVGQSMSLPDDKLKDLELGAILHDIGKFKIDDAILRKPGKLTDAEWVVMREHPMYGAELCDRFMFLRGASDVVRCHHEKWDGSGYPAGLRGEAIPLSARIFMVVDAYDTITSKRSYKEAESPETAMAEIRRCSGAHFDPQIVEVFERIFPEIAARTRDSMGTRRDAFAVVA